MTKNTNVFIALFFLLLSGCLIKPVEVITPWDEVLDFSTITPYRNMNATSTELHLISDDEFIRLDQSGDLIERRQISLPFKFFSRPMLGNLAIARIVRKQAQGNPILEFRSTRVQDQVIDLDFTTLDDMPNNPVDDNIFPEENARYSGAFNDQATRLLIPSINFSQNLHTFFLLKIDYNLAGNGINNVMVEKVIHIPEIPAANDVIDNIKFIDGNYYVVTKDGSFQIFEDGTYQRIFQNHFWDFFQQGNRIYGTDRSRRLFFSENGGENWDLSQDSSSLQQVEIANDEIFTQQALGFQFLIGTNNFASPEKMLYNPDFPIDFAAYRNVAFLGDFYYLTVQKQLFRIEEIMTDEE